MTERSRPNVLIVEDSQIAAGHLTEMLRASIPDAIIAIVATARDAIAAMGQLRPEVVILDLRLRENTGFSVLRALQAQSHRPIVLVHTNYALPKYRDYSFLLGADYFVDKAESDAVLPQIFDKIAHRLAERRVQS